MEKHYNYLVVMDTDGRGAATPLSLEALNAAKQAAGKMGAVVSVLLMGKNISGGAEQLQCHQVDKILISEVDGTGNYSPRKFLSVLKEACRMLNPELTVFGNSKNSLDLAARTAVALDLPLVTDCIGIDADDDGLTFTKPVYSNNVLAVYTVLDSPCIVTLRSKAVEPSIPTENQQGKIVDLGPVDESVADEYDIFDICVDEDGKKNLTDAEVIVSGGRGIGGPEGFADLEKLAGLLGGQVGATRPPCDLGWVSPDAQVGITGKIVSPAIYIAVGVSGSFQHMAGMSGAKTIVAINSDPEANIFKISDYGVVGEYEEVLPGFIKEIEDRL